MINDHQILYHLPRNTRPQGLQKHLSFTGSKFAAKPKILWSFHLVEQKLEHIYPLPLDPLVLYKHWFVSSVQNYFETENANIFVMKMSQ